MTRLFAFVVSAALLGASSALAQATPPAHISVVDGSATVDRETGSETAVADLPIVAGDRVHTTEGRAEILLGDGSALHLDEQTAIDVNAADVVRLLGGRLVLFAEPGAAGGVQVDASPASVRMVSPGEARLSLFDDGHGVFLDVAMVRGEAEIVTDSGTTMLQAGERVVVREGEAPGPIVSFNSAQADAFYQWSNVLLNSRRGTTSAEYLPAGLTSYGAALDENGSWSYLAPYGYVWYPHVEEGWRPYYHGRWCWRGADIGWTFVGEGQWTWPTHHYGRWGLTSAGGWFWIPGTTWSSAWVQWAVAPGYVSWCPLGPNNAPVVGFRTARGSGSHAWTVVRASVFDSGDNVPRHPINPHAFQGPTAPAFVVQTTPPMAVRRGTIGVVGPVARGTEPRAEHSRRGFAASVDGPSTGPVDDGRAVPRGPRVIHTPSSSAPSVVYYRGGTVTTDNGQGSARVPERSAVGVPHGEMPVHPRDAYASGGFVAPHGRNHPVMPENPGYVPKGFGPMPSSRYAPPPVPYRNGPPIIAVPRATVPGAGVPPLFAAPRATVPGAGVRPMVTGPPPAPAPPPPAPASGSSSSHATAAPRSGNPHR